MFQSLTWVERLSDDRSTFVHFNFKQFQSLTWVERLSDLSSQPGMDGKVGVSIPHLG